MRSDEEVEFQVCGKGCSERDGVCVHAASPKPNILTSEPQLEFHLY